MRKFKVLITVFAVVIAIFACSIAVNGKEPNLSEWNQCDGYSVLESGEKSNSDYTSIYLRVKREDSANRLHILFMLELSELDDVSNAGVEFDFGDMGSVTVMCDGSTDYDTDMFFAELDSISFDEYSNMILFEVTIGIKSGIPDDNLITFCLYDTYGVASNMYTVDLSEDEEETDGKTEKSKTSRTTKLKTTKKKTTKTTKSKKSKTTKTKTTKLKTSEEEATQTGRAVISEEFEDIERESDKNKLIIIGTIAVLACAAGGCTVGIINSRKKNNRGDE